MKLNDRTQAAIDDVISEACKKLTENINSYDAGDFCADDAREVFEALVTLSELYNKEENKP